MIQGLTHQGTEFECSVCHCEFDVESEGGVIGYFGILPVAFCPTCYSSCCDMVLGDYGIDPETIE